MYPLAQHQNGQTAKQIIEAAEEARAELALYNANTSIQYPNESDRIFAHALGVEL